MQWSQGGACNFPSFTPGYRKISLSLGGCPNGRGRDEDGRRFGATLSWHDVAVIIECKLQKEKSQSIARSQLKRAAELVFCNQFRLFVWGIFVFSHKDKDNPTKYKYKLHLYTRSGILYSKEHDLDTESQQFCDLLVDFPI